MIFNEYSIRTECGKPVFKVTVNTGNTHRIIAYACAEQGNIFTDKDAQKVAKYVAGKFDSVSWERLKLHIEEVK